MLGILILLRAKNFTGVQPGWKFRKYRGQGKTIDRTSMLLTVSLQEAFVLQIRHDDLFSKVSFTAEHNSAFCIDPLFSFHTC